VILPAHQARPDAGRQRRHRDLVEVELRAGDAPLAPVAEQHVARDRQQIGAERRLPAVRLAATQTGEEGLLHEVVDVALGLHLEEPIDRREVAREELIASRRIPGNPLIEQLQIHVRHSRHRSARRSAARSGVPRVGS
jgi:hypothetical protein